MSHVKVSTSLNIVHGSQETWPKVLYRQLEKRYAEDDILMPPIESPSDYESIDLYVKILMLKELCDWQWEQPEHFRNKLQENAESPHWVGSSWIHS